MIPLVILGLVVLWAFAGHNNWADKPAWVSSGSAADWDMWLRGWWVPKTRYVEQVNAAAIRCAVPQPLIEAVLFVESSDGRNTTGSAGEIGVMQIMPGTLQDIRKAWPTLGDADVNTVGGNIILGAAYLRMGYEIHGNWRQATIGYNAGHGSERVKNLADEYLRKVENRLREILQ